MKKEKISEKTPKDGGFGARLTFAIIFTLGALVCLILVGVFSSPNGYNAFLLSMLGGLTAGFGFYAALGYLGAIAGVKHKWADVLLIIFAAPMCLAVLGILAVAGGSVAIKDINDPSRIEARKAKREKGAGFGLRLSFAIILSVFTVTFAVLGSGVAGGGITQQVFMLCACGFAPITVLQYVATFAGKKHKWANVISIVIGSVGVVIYFLGILAIVGGARGIAPFKKAEKEAKAKAEEEERARREAEQAALNGGKELQSSTEPVAEEEEVLEYIQPKMGVKGKKAIMITLIVSYSLLLLMGILLASVPAMSKIFSGLGICDELSARAYSIIVGVMWVSLSPAIGFYYVTVSPYELSKKIRIVIAILTTVLMVAMDVVFFVIINTVKVEIGLDTFAKLKDCFENSDKWFIPLSMVFASLGLMICHALTLFKINPAKIRNRKPEKCGDGFMAVIKHVFALLIYGILGLVKFILTCKEKQPDIFILVATILLTWLAHFVSFVFAIICIAVLIGVIVMYFAGVISFAYTPSGSTAEKVYRDEYGNDITLTEQTYVKEDRYQKVYKDENGNEYVSNDGGKHVNKD